MPHLHTSILNLGTGSTWTEIETCCTHAQQRRVVCCASSSWLDVSTEWQATVRVLVRESSDAELECRGAADQYAGVTDRSHPVATFVMHSSLRMHQTGRRCKEVSGLGRSAVVGRVVRRALARRPWEGVCPACSVATHAGGSPSSRELGPSLGTHPLHAGYRSARP